MYRFTVDNKLNSAERSVYVKRKISKFGILNKAKRVLTKSYLVTLYYSFIFPYLTYRIDVWGIAFES